MSGWIQAAMQQNSINSKMYEIMSCSPPGSTNFRSKIQNLHETFTPSDFFLNTHTLQDKQKI